jgi:hypothetical protein
MRNLLKKNRAFLGPATGLLANRFIGEGKPVDVKLGIALLRDRRVPVGSKLLALAGGIGIIMLLEALEFPAEWFLSLLMPVIGFGISAAVDGLETIAGSFLLAAALLPFIAPREMVNRIRNERFGPIPVPVSSRNRR